MFNKKIKQLKREILYQQGHIEKLYNQLRAEAFITEKGIDCIIRYNVSLKTIEVIGGYPNPRQLYSSIKQNWRDNMFLTPHQFPIKSHTPQYFEMINGWTIFPEKIDFSEVLVKPFISSNIDEEVW
jgi:hypothetical protein